MDFISLYWGQLPLDLSNLSKKKLAKIQNSMEFSNLFENYFTLAQNLFEWKGLPETCDARFLERALLLTGRAMIARVDGAYVTLAAAPGAGVNLYGYPIKGYGYGMNGFNREFNLYVPGADDSGVLRKASDGRMTGTEPEAVVCWDNVDAYPYVGYIVNGAQRLADMMRACDVAVQNLKTPLFITCDEAQQNSVKRALEDRQDNMIAIIASKSLTMDQFKAWPIGVQPDTLEQFWQQFRNIEAQLLEILGVNSNANTDKKERLLVDEVNANNENINSNLMKRLHQRELFCERVNNAFGLNVSVKIREEVRDNDPDGVSTDPSTEGTVHGERDRQRDPKLD